MIFSKIIVTLAMLIATVEDLKKWKVRNSVFLLGFLASIGFAIYQHPLPFVGSMIVQGALGLIAGLFMNLIGKFGMADVYSLALISSLYPDMLIFVVLAFLLVPMMFWVKITNFFLRSDKGVPAIPGIFIGYLILLSYYGI